MVYLQVTALLNLLSLKEKPHHDLPAVHPKQKTRKVSVLLALSPAAGCSGVS
jgi:hypothetical protein